MQSVEIRKCIGIASVTSQKMNQVYKDWLITLEKEGKILICNVYLTRSQCKFDSLGNQPHSLDGFWKYNGQNMRQIWKY